ncbi:hypothetical protein GIY23_18245 [Allosaccharopolyspora coralli]|uniref:Uncharacterized protein n=1 Tax=Allosaccharopolyspora coralli TaxID=2665642 RepID=A0A5Q3QA08_9PSEU|nr:hypothetical protein [Allosaccharopolyspora coralli]QGK71203.1 hypothetical protein GIY23_18245 [Allosaccharopolyspora coralli]
MGHFQTTNAVEDIDKAMSELRRSMRGLQIRTAGFKRDHDELARAVSAFTVDLTDATPKND